MKAITVLTLLGCALAAAPARPEAAGVDYPQNFTVVHVKSSGSGCPIESKDRRVSVVDYMWASFDDNDQAGGTWSYALNLPPTLGAALWTEDNSERMRSCTHEWKLINSKGYRLVAHKNSTEVIARYRLGNNVSAVWKITYYNPDGTEVSRSSFFTQRC
jgi:hypothetical protein